MKKTPAPTAAKLPSTATRVRKSSLFRKAARLGATVVAARVLIAGAGAKRLIMRYPVGAMVLTGAYLAGKLYEAKREADRKMATKLLTDASAKPILIDEVRAARKKAG
ncbi:MAG: hypothetical protein DI554_19150 [Sphingobium sp.]|nr:MAG: hypothetical protein DI554_19150 [Sphingobium sp.]